MLSSAHRIDDLDLYDDHDEPLALPVARGTVVLVVDDDAAMRDLIALRLHLLGLTVETARSVPDAIAELEIGGIGAVVSDHRMPRATGLELLAYVQRRRLQIPFVLMTGDLTPELEEAALEGGAAAALDKGDLLDVLPDLFFVAAPGLRGVHVAPTVSQGTHR